MGLVKLGGNDMGTLSKLLFIATSLAAANVYASNTVTVPYQFSDGGVASASQVNANFSALTNAVTALQSQVGPSVTVTPLDITQTPLPPGTTITVDGVSYIIVRTSIPAFATDTRVWVDMPVQLGTGDTAIQVLSFAPGSFNAIAAQYKNSPITTTINGVSLGCSESFNYYFQATTGNSSTSTRSGNQNYSQYLNCIAQIDSNTELQMDLAFPTAKATVTGTSLTPADFSNVDPYTVTPVASRRDQIQTDLRSLLSYVVFSAGH